MLRAALPGYPTGVIIRLDKLSPDDRKAHRIDDLVNREMMLRPSGRKGGVVYIASLAVLAWSAEDMLSCLTRAASRGMTVRVLDADLTIGADARAALLHKAAQAFAAARERRREIERGRTGGSISGKKRSDAARAKAEAIKLKWADERFRTVDLLKEAGITYNTAKLYLGSRLLVLQAQAAAAKRRARRSKT
jgi:hypothetical protein